MKFISTIFLSILFVCHIFTANAQSKSTDIKGFVYDKGTGEPMIFTNVVLAGTQQGSQTDINGYFYIRKVAFGKYTLMITAVGYDSSITPITIASDDIVNQRIYLQKRSRQLKQIKISGRKTDNLTQVQIGQITVTPNQINQLPSVGGEPDLAQYLQIIPGVVSSGDQGGQLYIRGGSPVQNRIMLDGMTIYNPFHSLGLFSVFETDIMKNAEVKTAGFNADYGGATSAIIDVSTRDGNRKRLSGKISANTFASKVILEGPLKKLDEKEGGSSSFIITAKSSYLDKSSPIFYPYADSVNKKLPYKFTDIYGKLTFTSNSGSKLNLFGFNFTDAANFGKVANFGWNATGGGLNFIVAPPNSSTLISGIVAGSNYSLNLSEADGLPRSSTIKGFNSSIDLGYVFENNSNLNIGIEINSFSTTYTFYNILKLKVGDGEDQNTSEFATYFKYKIVKNKWVIEPGLRLPYYSTLNAGSIEPRFGVKYNATNYFRLKAAAGRYSQNLISTKSDKDIVNLFTGFLSGPQENLKNTEGDNINNPLQRAWHAVLGFESDINKNLEFSAETYFKDYTQLINISRDKLKVQDPNYIVETGNAYGIDFLAKYEYKRFYLWLAYSLAYTNRYDGTKNADGSKYYYSPSFDRRNNINTLLSYTFGKNLNWEFGTRYNFGSGFPFTLTQGFYEQQYFLEGLTSNYVSGQGQLGVLYDKKLNGGRLPNYHRVDVSLKRKFFVGKNGVLEMNASISNTLNRPNMFYYDRINQRRINQLPILPAVGFNYTF
ncbi:MAG: hypothetical protein RJA07_2175 [Bacteroidota bacterium]|jgi:hypothetical protein